MATAERRLAEGASLRQVGKELGVSYETVRKWAIRHGWGRRVSAPLSDGEFGKIRMQTDGRPEIRAPWHPNADGRGMVRLNRYIMANLLGRKLQPWEHVKHIDGDTLNNEPENLEIQIVVRPRYREAFKQWGLQNAGQGESSDSSTG